jgi:hypothetical protein
METVTIPKSEYQQLINIKGAYQKLVGITQVDAAEMWKNRKKLLGKTARVVYMNETLNMKGQKSLYLPKFMEVRDDK